MNWFINFFLGTGLSCSLLLAGAFALYESLRWISVKRRAQSSPPTPNVFPDWKDSWREKVTDGHRITGTEKRARLRG